MFVILPPVIEFLVRYLLRFQLKEVLFPDTLYSIIILVYQLVNSITTINIIFQVIIVDLHIRGIICGDLTCTQSTPFQRPPLLSG